MSHRRSVLKRKRERKRRRFEQKMLATQLASRKVSTAQLFEVIEKFSHILRDVLTEAEQN